MNKFKTKYQFLPSTIDEMQYIKRDNSESMHNDQNLHFKNPNYTVSHVKAISGSKYLNIKSNRLSGKGVNKEKNIYLHDDWCDMYVDMNISFIVSASSYTMLQNCIICLKLEMNWKLLYHKTIPETYISLNPVNNQKDKYLIIEEVQNR